MRVLKFFPILLALYEIVTYLSNDMYLPALPQMAQDLMTTNELAQLSLTTWFLGAASMQLILGPLSDRYGRKPVLLLGGILFVIATIICAIAPNISTMLIARFFQGCAVCSVTVAGYAAIHELYDQTAAMKALALMASITVLAPSFGPLAGSLFLQFAGWREMFWFLALWAIAILLVLYKWMPESHPPANRHPLAIKTIAGNYGAILTTRNFMLNALAFCATFSGMIAWIAMGPFLVIEKFHYSPIVFGIFQVMVFGSFIIGARFVNIGLQRIGVTKLIVISITIAICGTILSVVTATIWPTILIAFVITLMIFTFGNALAFGPLQRLAIEASEAPMGARMAIFSTLMSGAGVVGSFLAGMIYTGTSQPLAYLVLITAIVAGLLRKGVKHS